MIIKYDVSHDKINTIDLQKLHDATKDAIWYCELHKYNILDTQIIQTTGSYSTEEGFRVEYRLQVKIEEKS